MSRLLDKDGGSEGAGSSDNSTADTGFLNESGKWSHNSMLAGTGGKKVARRAKVGLMFS